MFSVPRTPAKMQNAVIVIIINNNNSARLIIRLILIFILPPKLNYKMQHTLEQYPAIFSQIFSNYQHYDNILRQLNTITREGDKERFLKEACHLLPSNQEVQEYFLTASRMVMFEIFHAVTEASITSNISAALMYPPNHKEIERHMSNQKREAIKNVQCTYVSYGYQDTEHNEFADNPAFWIDRETYGITFNGDYGIYANGSIAQQLIDSGGDDRLYSMPTTLPIYMNIDIYSRFPQYRGPTWGKVGDGTAEYEGTVRYMLDVVSEYNILKQRESCEQLQPGFAKQKVLENFRATVKLLSGPRFVYQQLELYLLYNTAILSSNLLNLPDMHMNNGFGEGTIEQMNEEYQQYVTNSLDNKHKPTEFIETSIANFD